MPHQNPNSSKATAQNAATDPSAPNDQAREQEASAHPEPRSYAAHDVRDSTLAAPAAGEIADYMDEGDPLGEDADGVQQGSNHTNWEMHAQHTGMGDRPQGAKTREANRRMAGSGSPDQGTE